MKIKPDREQGRQEKGMDQMARTLLKTVSLLSSVALLPGGAGDGAIERTAGQSGR